jgi:hypothetical protein
MESLSFSSFQQTSLEDKPRDLRLSERVEQSSAFSFVKALFPTQSFSRNDHLQEVEAYVIIHPYQADEAAQTDRYVAKAVEVLEKDEINPQAFVLVVLYEEIKVAFPERKLNREKYMANLNSEEILQQAAPSFKDRIRIVYEFGTHDLRDTQELLKKASNIYFDCAS